MRNEQFTQQFGKVPVVRGEQVVERLAATRNGQHRDHEYVQRHVEHCLDVDGRLILRVAVVRLYDTCVVQQVDNDNVDYVDEERRNELVQILSEAAIAISPCQAQEARGIESLEARKHYCW